MTSAIRVHQLGKKYLLNYNQGTQQYDVLREMISDKVSGLFRSPLALLNLRKENALVNEFWALSNVSFDVDQGERIGIIGRNGAGKSTLLKILSRIVEPTRGSVALTGRVASLLEVGTGFHPELSGRENIFLNGAILGMKRTEIKRKFDEIVDFAEVSTFLDTPVKRYSSGMYVRLAFAVAAHLDPEILLVDEVLAVGDAHFQKKCLGKMKEVGTRGRTVVFVSHNLVALQSMCSRGIWIDSGRVVADAPIETVIPAYLKKMSCAALERVWEDPEEAPGNEHFRIMSVRVRPENVSHDTITVSTPVEIEFSCLNLHGEALLNFSLVLYDELDTCIFNTGSTAAHLESGLIRGVCHIPPNFLNDGLYRIRLLIVKDRSIPLVDLDDVVSFEVHDVQRDGGWFGKWIGAVRPQLQWEIGQISEE